MKTIEERADKYIDNNFTRIADEMPICEGMKTIYVESATEQKAIDDKQTKELLQYLEELEAHYRELGQYDDGKPIRRVKEYIKSMEKRYA